MNRLRAVAAVVVLIASCAFAQSTQAKHASSAKPGSKSKPTTKMTDPKQIQQTALVIDTHADTPGRFVDENFDPATDAGRGHWDFAKARSANLGAEFFSIWVDPQIYKGHEARRALAMIDSVYETARKHPDQMTMAFSTEDIRKARSGPKPRIAALLGLEGGHAIEGDIRLLRDYYRLGVRYMTLTWANSNELGQSSGDYKKDEATGKIIDHGLTDFGRAVVKEMNRLGMMVDISHVSDRSFANALTVSRAPVIASHSSARAITDHARNMTDEMLVNLARYNGGVAQVNFNCGFISNEYNTAMKAYSAAHPDEVKRYDEMQLRWEATHDPALRTQLDAMQTELQKFVPRPPFTALIDHIDHMVKVAGVDHVGIGSDFDGVPCLPQGIDSVGDLPKITEALVQRGYSAEDIHKIMGGNLMRVFTEVEKVAREMQNEENPDTRPEVKLPAVEKK